MSERQSDRGLKPLCKLIHLVAAIFPLLRLFGSRPLALGATVVALMAPAAAVGMLLAHIVFGEN